MIATLGNLLTQLTARRRAAILLRGIAQRLRWRLAERKSTLIGLAEHLGDVVAAEPISRYLKENDPHARIVWVVNRAYAPLVGCFPAVDVVLPLDAMGQWLVLRKGLGGKVIDLHLQGRWCAWTNVVIERPGATVSLENYYDRRNLLAAFCEAGGLSDLNDVEGFDATPSLHLPDTAQRAVDRLDLPKRFVVVHATSNQPERDWQADQWADIAGALANAGVAVVEVGLKSTVNGARSLCGCVSLVEMAEVIRRSTLFLGVDSGPAHLANAVGAPGVILLGTYCRWQNRMPYSGRFEQGGATIVRHDGPLAEMPSSAVLAELRNRGLL